MIVYLEVNMNEYSIILLQERLNEVQVNKLAFSQFLLNLIKIDTGEL